MKRSIKSIITFGVMVIMVFAMGMTVSAQEDGVKKVFDVEYYLKANPDLRQIYGNDAEALYTHFLRTGADEGRSMTPLFDVNRYKERYPELVQQYGDDNLKYYHDYFSKGIVEGRESCGLFDAGAYANAYKDLKRSLGYDAKALYDHYMTIGVKEGRDKGLKFNEICYITLNPELKEKFGTNQYTLYMQYLNAGLETGLKGAFSKLEYKYSYCEKDEKDLKHIITKWTLLEDPTKTGTGAGYDEGTCEICGQVFKERITKIDYRYE